MRIGLLSDISKTYCLTIDTITTIITTNLLGNVLLINNIIIRHLQLDSLDKISFANMPQPHQLTQYY